MIHQPPDPFVAPRGLVDYMALSDEPREREGKAPRSIWKHILRPRTIMYTTLWSLVGVGLVFALFVRSHIDMSIAPVRNPVYVTLSDGSIRNTYDVRLRNMTNQPTTFRLFATGRTARRMVKPSPSHARSSPVLI